MKAKALVFGTCVVLLALVSGYSTTQKHRWAVHDKNRPQPKAVVPGEQPGQSPSDAIILFDGYDLSQWVSTEGDGPAKWKLENGYMEVIKKTGSLRTKRSFGDYQLHIEWATPTQITGSGQDRGNSGVYLMGRYEVQVLDSYNNTTYPDGQAASIYGQNPPMVNACRPPGQWQSYDIIFHRPDFRNLKPATITVLHNGVLVQDHWVLEGTTEHKKRAGYTPHEDKLPLMLQNHGNPVRYRNIWLRELPEPE
jgi:hypothetical protein